MSGNMKKLLGIIAILGSLVILFTGGSNCISGKASKQGMECFVDASLTPLIVIIIVIYLIIKKKI